MLLNAYMLLIIYARVGLTQLYITCLSCLLNVEIVIYQFKLELESSMGIYITGPSLVDQYPITLVHIVGFKIIKNRTNILQVLGGSRV